MNRATDRPLPHNLHNAGAERALLGALLIDQSQWSAAEHLSPNDFFVRQNREIFRIIHKLIQTGTVVDLVTVIDALEKADLLGSAGGAGYVSGLTDGVPLKFNVAGYVKIIQERALRRQLLATAEQLGAEASAHDTEPGDAAARAQKTLAQLSGDRFKIVQGNGKLVYGLEEFLTTDFPVPEHLIEGLVPRRGSVLIYALPHHLKSIFTTALALASTTAGTAFGLLEVKKPVRTLLVQLEDFPGDLQDRVRGFLEKKSFLGCDPENLKILPRCDLSLPDEAWMQKLLHHIIDLRIDHVIFDVLRRMFRGKFNNAEEVAEFVRQVDRLRDTTGCATTLVHHAKKGEAELLTGAEGSVHWSTWAQVVVEVRHKVEEKIEGRKMTHAEMGIDSKWGSRDPMRITYEPTSEEPLRLALLEDSFTALEAMDRLGDNWTVRDLSDAQGLHRANAYRRIKKWLLDGTVEKLSGGQRGRGHQGLARYRFLLTKP